MSEREILAFLLSAISMLSMISAAYAQTRITGVRIGDWYRYTSFSANWYSNDTNTAIPAWLKEQNETEWYLISVVDIHGTNVTTQNAQRFKNGTERIILGYVDVETGATNNTGATIISADLTETDTVYAPGQTNIGRINETVTRAYPDGARETNHMNLTQIYSPNNETRIYYAVQYYWDRLTGVLVEFRQEASNKTGIYLSGYSQSFRLTSSDVWAIPEFPTAYMMILPMMTTLLVGFAFARASCHKRRRSLQTR